MPPYFWLFLLSKYELHFILSHSLFCFSFSFAINTHAHQTTYNHKRGCSLQIQTRGNSYTKRVKLVGFQTDNVWTDIDTGTYNENCWTLFNCNFFYHRRTHTHTILISIHQQVLIFLFHLFNFGLFALDTLNTHIHIHIHYTWKPEKRWNKEKRD